MNCKDEFIVGIDFGLKRIGLAVCNKGLTISLPSKMIEAKASDEETIKAIIKCFTSTIDRFVLGLPLYLDGNESAMTLRVKEFGVKLEAISCKPVNYIDEGLTSETSEELLKDCGLKRKERIPFKDVLSAQLILNDFLTNNGHR